MIVTIKLSQSCTLAFKLEKSFIEIGINNINRRFWCICFVILKVVFPEVVVLEIIQFAVGHSFVVISYQDTTLIFTFYTFSQSW